FIKKEIEEAKKRTNETKDINEILLKTSNDINKSLPFTVNSEITLLSTAAGNKIFRYNYSLLNFISSEVPQDAIDSTRQYTVSRFCSEQDTKEFRDNDVTV